MEKAIKWFFELVDKSKCKAIKQLQAYYRRIDFAYRTDIEVEKAFLLLEKSKINKEKFSKQDMFIIQDYTMRRMLEVADTRKLPYQIHTGMTNLSNSNPNLLESIFNKYPNLQLVLLHTYPFVSTACFLARAVHNVYLDTSWQVLQSPGILKKCLNEWIGMVPYKKITLSIDATNLEEYYGGQVMTVKILTDVLEKKQENAEITEKTAKKIALALLFDNANDLY